LFRSSTAGAAGGRNEGAVRTVGSGKRARKCKKMAKNGKKRQKVSNFVKKVTFAVVLPRSGAAGAELRCAGLTAKIKVLDVQ